MKSSKNSLFGCFLKNNSFIKTTAIVALFGLALSFTTGVYQVTKSIVASISHNQDPAAMVIMLTFGYLVPLIIYAVCWLIFMNRRRAERVFYGFVFSGVYWGVVAVFQALSFSSPIFSGLAGQPLDVSIWLQFWPSYIGLLVVVISMMGFRLQEGSRWQVAPYWIILISYGLSALGMALLQASTLYYNEGARLQVGSYENFIQLVMLIVVFIWIYRQKSQNVMLISVVLFMWITLRSISYFAVMQTAGDPLPDLIILAGAVAAWIAYIRYAKIVELSRKKA
ncbi:hypothetical protein GX865_03235 [Candidatus Saccharibacteria bacterium]|jgi:hypothetical protein|nr:hypothetical protein [Candidatus Saccharibacteria bacterium]